MNEAFAATHALRRLVELNFNEKTEIDYFLNNTTIYVSNFENLVHFFFRT
jgi:hypothetical protein